VLRKFCVAGGFIAYRKGIMLFSIKRSNQVWEERSRQWPDVFRGEACQGRLHANLVQDDAIAVHAVWPTTRNTGTLNVFQFIKKFLLKRLSEQLVACKDPRDDLLKETTDSASRRSW